MDWGYSYFSHNTKTEKTNKKDHKPQMKIEIKNQTKENSGVKTTRPEVPTV